MTSIASVLIAASAFVVLTLGSIHLLYTFRGQKLHPRDPQLLAAMQQAHPVLTRQTTMWKAWVGFNASHSMGAMLFGLVYGYLAVAQTAMLFQSWFLLGLGLATLAAYVLLAKVYWFSIPFRGIVLATVLYAIGVVASVA